MLRSQTGHVEITTHSNELVTIHVEVNGVEGKLIQVECKATYIHRYLTDLGHQVHNGPVVCMVIDL